jgi:hypothetical protein
MYEIAELPVREVACEPVQFGRANVVGDTHRAWPQQSRQALVRAQWPVRGRERVSNHGRHTGQPGHLGTGWLRYGQSPACTDGLEHAHGKSVQRLRGGRLKPDALPDGECVGQALFRVGRQRVGKYRDQ